MISLASAERRRVLNKVRDKLLEIAVNDENASNYIVDVEVKDRIEVAVTSSEDDYYEWLYAYIRLLDSPKMLVYGMYTIADELYSYYDMDTEYIDNDEELTNFCKAIITDLENLVSDDLEEKEQLEEELHGKSQ